MDAIQRLCGIGSRMGQPSGDGQIGYVDLQVWAKQLGLLKTGKPDPRTGLTQKHPPGLVNLVAFGLTGKLEKTARTRRMFDVKRRETHYEFQQEAAKRRKTITDCKIKVN